MNDTMGSVRLQRAKKAVQSSLSYILLTLRLGNNPINPPLTVNELLASWCEGIHEGMATVGICEELN
jgi:hypothetical protein